MKTDALITLLSHDARVRLRFPALMLGATAIAVTSSTIVFLGMMGVRPDFMAAIETARFLFKLAFTGALTLAAGNVLSWVGRPERSLRARALLLLTIPAMLAAAVVTEMIAMPVTTWYPRMVGHNAMACLTYIPLLSIAPLVLFLTALKYGAPKDAGTAGAVAGLTAAGIASVLFAIHCDNDSPLFVAIWYPLTFAITATGGYAVGRKWLRW